MKQHWTRTAHTLRPLAWVLLLPLLVACTPAEAEPEPTPAPHYEFTDDLLRLIPFGPTDLSEGSPVLTVSAESGVISNEDLASTSFDQADSAATWAEAGRLTGYNVQLETYEPAPLFVMSGADMYRDEAAARKGFLLAARDLWESEGQAAEGLLFREQQERRIADLADEAVLQTSAIDFQDAAPQTVSASTEAIGFRSGNVVAFVQVVQFDGADGDFDIEALAQLLRNRIDAVAAGTATWDPVSVEDNTTAGDAYTRSPLRTTPAAVAATAAAPVTDGCGGTGPRVCLVPLAGYAAPDLGPLVQHLVEQGVPAGSLAPVDLQIADIDSLRQQLNALRAVERVAAAYPELAANPQVTLIALTDHDMFIEGQSFNWVFGMRGGESLIISTARMDERFWGGVQDDDLKDTRLRKMLLRYVGLFHLGLPENDSALTVLYRHLDGLPELDAMLEGILQPSDLPQPTTELAAWAGSFCSAAEASYVRWYDAYVALNNVLGAEHPESVYRTAVVDYLVESRDAGIDFQETLDALPPVADGGALGLSVFYAAIAGQGAWVADVYPGLIANVEASATLAQISGLLTTFSIEAFESPANQAIETAYLELDPSVTVALNDAGPCGFYEPSAFPSREVI